MISPSFYNKKNTVEGFLDNDVLCYPAKSPSVTWEWYDHILEAHETLFTVAARIFGQNLEYMWTLIADNNPPVHPDDWRAGDVIRLPRIIIRDSDTQDVNTRSRTV